MKKNEEEQTYYILEDEMQKEEKHHQIWLFVIFALCFLFVSFTATFSFFRLKSVLEPIEPVIDIEPSSEEPTSSSSSSSSSNNNRPSSIINPIIDISSTNEPAISSSSKEEVSSSSNQISSSSSQISSSSSSSSDEPEIDDGTTKIIKVVYLSGTEINIDTSVLPGWNSQTKVIKVTNLSDVTLKYQVKWIDVINNFNRKDDLTYHIALNENELANGTLPSQNAVLMNNVTIRRRETQYIKINVKYANLNLDQSIDMGKIFSGTVTIDAVE